MNWKSVRDKLPNDFEIVVTQLFDGSITINSIQHRNHPDAAGKENIIRQWANNNIGVVNWISIPKVPNIKKDLKNDT